MVKPETITMSMQELDRLKTIQAVVARLDLTRRQVNRFIQGHLDAGACGLVSRKCGKPSNYQLPAGVADTAVSIIRERYQDFAQSSRTVTKVLL